jgi:hypothetical protein
LRIVKQISPTERVGPKLEKNRGSYFFENRLNKYAIPFMVTAVPFIWCSFRALTLYGTVGSR